MIVLKSTHPGTVRARRSLATLPCVSVCHDVRQLMMSVNPPVRVCPDLGFWILGTARNETGFRSNETVFRATRFHRLRQRGSRVPRASVSGAVAIQSPEAAGFWIPIRCSNSTGHLGSPLRIQCSGCERPSRWQYPESKRAVSQDPHPSSQARS